MLQIRPTQPGLALGYTVTGKIWCCRIWNTFWAEVESVYLSVTQLTNVAGGQPQRQTHAFIA
jgi:hypothetical protein